jgi:hypothetical protein
MMNIIGDVIGSEAKDNNPKERRTTTQRNIGRTNIGHYQFSDSWRTTDQSCDGPLRAEIPEATVCFGVRMRPATRGAIDN